MADAQCGRGAARCPCVKVDVRRREARAPAANERDAGATSSADARRGRSHRCERRDLCSYIRQTPAASMTNVARDNRPPARSSSRSPIETEPVAARVFALAIFGVALLVRLRARLATPSVAVFRRADRRRARLRRMGAAHRRPATGSAATCSTRRRSIRISSASSTPSSATACWPSASSRRCRVGVVRAARARRRRASSRRGRARRRPAAGGLRAGDLLRRADAEIGARRVLRLPGAVAAQRASIDQPRSSRDSGSRSALAMGGSEPDARERARLHRRDPGVGAFVGVG